MLCAFLLIMVVYRRNVSVVGILTNVQFEVYDCALLIKRLEFCARVSNSSGSTLSCTLSQSPPRAKYISSKTVDFFRAAER